MRGSSQARAADRGRSDSAARSGSAGRPRTSPSATTSGDQRDHATRCPRPRYAERDQAGAEERADDRAQAETGMEARHDGAPQAVVRPRRPRRSWRRPRPRCPRRRGTTRRRSTRQRLPQRSAATERPRAATRPRGAPPVRCRGGRWRPRWSAAPPGSRTAVARSTRPRLDVGQLEARSHLGDPGDPGREQQPVEEERQRDGVARSRHRRFQSVPGGPASSQDWKPVSEASLMASSSGWSSVVAGDHHVPGVERDLLGALGTHGGPSSSGGHAPRPAWVAVRARRCGTTRASVRSSARARAASPVRRARRPAR